MGIGYTLLLVLHVLICLLIILLVTLQNDKGGGLGGAFGGMGGGAAFTGGAAVTILTKVTQWIGIVSFVVLLSLNALSTRGSSGPGESELGRATQGLSGAVPTSTLGPTETGTETNAPIPGLGGGESQGSQGTGTGE